MSEALKAAVEYVSRQGDLQVAADQKTEIRIHLITNNDDDRKHNTYNNDHTQHTSY